MPSSSRRTQALALERCGPFEFAAAVNVALSKAQPPKSPLAPLLDPVRAAVGPALGPALGPMFGSILGSSGGPAFMQPPIIETAVGPPAKSFPLHLVHAGRCCLNAIASRSQLDDDKRAESIKPTRARAMSIMRPHARRSVLDGSRAHT